MSEIKELAGVPEISFIGNMTLREFEEMVREYYVQAYRDITGDDPDMSEGCIANLLIKAFCAVEYQTLQYIDAKGRAEMLPTSTGAALDSLAALVGLIREKPSRATVTQRFTLSQTLPYVVSIPVGTRVRTGDGRYFATRDYAEIKRGGLYAETTAEAEIEGAEGNVMEGAINILVDPIPYIAQTSNTTPSTGGVDTENDDALTRRIFLAPSVFSCAGPKDAYEYYARAWRSDVADVKLENPSPCCVNIYFTVQDGESVRVPTESEMQEMERYMSADQIRPMGDYIRSLAPVEVEYNIYVAYWIAASDQQRVGEIQERVNRSVSEFTQWQRKLGRDVNPTELIARMRQAGAKRVKLAAPGDIPIGKTELPKAASITVTYGGLEDD